MFLRLHSVILSCSILGTSAFAGAMGPVSNPQGFFIGAGGSINAVRIHQDSWGLGLSNLYTNGVLTSQGVAQGNAAPFQKTSFNFAPAVQAGYLKNFNTNNYYGIKFSYQYLGSVATNRDLYLPQTGELRSFNPPSTSSMFGYAIADSVETTINHNMSLLALIGKQLGNKYIYLGAGPSLTSIQSQNYNSIGYAIVDGATLNVTGLVNYGSPTIWAWGGAAQIGMSYFINSSWFVDASYTYSVAGNYTSSHKQSFAHTASAGSTTIETSGILATKDTFKATMVQSVTVSLNKIFDL
ncbi:outer membrane protein [Legionella rowbothamii]|uniref:outer membrane protein n=1 Tax=Legionella rowbothamii TaxID=96229 RepID=UPI001054F799|nr:hypothetical protein [Legionella rowbothamii]